MTNTHERVEVPEEKLTEFVKNGEIQPFTLVWTEGIEDWKPIRDVKPDLFAESAPPEQARPQEQPPPVPVDSPPSALPKKKSLSPTLAEKPARTASSYTQPDKTHGSERASGKAVAAFVCGLLSFFLCGLFAAFPAVICGHMALKENMSLDRTAGGGMAKTGLVFGYLCLVGTLVAIVVFVFYGMTIANLASSGDFDFEGSDPIIFESE